MKRNECHEHAHVGSNLSESQKSEVSEILSEFDPVLTDAPGRTNLIEYTLPLSSNEPVRSKAYPIPLSMRKTVENEISYMLELGIIEESESQYASPIVLVRKKDGSNRFCIDFRKLNKIALFDPEPIPNSDELMSKLSEAKYFSKIDLAKGYWQIPVSDTDKNKLAFITHAGLFQFRVMPFGVMNASAVFSRMMRRLLKGMSNTVNYIDDILLYTETWDEHMILLNEVFKRLKHAGLTARPSKCHFGYSSLEFLGHKVGSGRLGPLPEKIDKIIRASIPKTKKDVRSFMGLASYYSKFIPNFTAIAAPLTDLTKSRCSNKVAWGPAQDKAFTTLKSRLSNAPILRLPDLNKPFTLRCDASDVGIGAVLMQEEDGVMYPICYASRKLQPREVRYSTIEKECLALVWALDKFYIYLYGVDFMLETDHHPLSYINTTKTF